MQQNILSNIASYIQIPEIKLDILKVTQITQYSAVYLELLWDVSRIIRYAGSQISHRTQYLARYLIIHTDTWNWIGCPKSNRDIFIYRGYGVVYRSVFWYISENKICWRRSRFLNIFQDISVCHLVQRHIVRVTVAGQASGSDSGSVWFRLWLAVTASPRPIPKLLWSIIGNNELIITYYRPIIDLVIIGNNEFIITVIMSSLLR